MHAAERTDPPDLLGRATELRAVGRAVSSLTGGQGSVLVVEGAAGTGKTRLLSALADRAPTALRARAVELDGSLPLGVAGRLLGRALDELGVEWRDKRISGSALTEAGAWTLYALSEGVTELVARHGPQVLVVDDVQWADVQSVELLAYLGSLAIDLPLLVAVGSRPGGMGDTLAKFGAMPGAQRLRLTDLPVPLARTLVQQRLPDATAALVDVCVSVTGGNPMLLHELTEAIRASGTAAHPDTPGRISGMAPQTVTDGVLTRLGQLGKAAAELARAVAILGDGTPLRHAAQLAGLDAEAAARAADRLVEAAVVTGGPELSFRHPLLAEAVLRDLGDFTRARRYRQAALVVAADGLIDLAGAHLLRTEPVDDPEVVQLLRAAATDALDRGDPRSGARLLQRALAEPPAPSERPTLLSDLARAEAASGDAGALDHLEEALSAMPDPRRRAETLDELSRLLYLRSDFTGALEVAERALAQFPGRADEERLQATWLLAAGMVAERYARSRQITEQLAAACRTGHPPHDSDLRAIAALHLVCTGFPGPATDIAVAALDGDLDVNGPGPGYALSVLAWTGQFARLTDAATRVHVAASGQNSLLGASMAAYWHARGRLEVGDLAGAGDDLRRARAPEGLGWHAYRHLTAALLAEVRLEDGDMVGAAAAVDDVPEGEVPNPVLRHARGRVALASGDFDGAAREFATSGDVLQHVWQIDGPLVVPWRSGAALAALGRDDRSGALELSDGDVRLARRDGVPAVLARTLRAQGLVVGGEAGVDVLREAVDVAASSESVLEQVRCQVDLGAALRRAGDRRAAREVLARARDRAESAGLTALSARAREEQSASGARPRRVALTGAASLTPSELRVARLASTGATNREIAAELYLSPKTVGWHLGSVFRKLDVSSRRALAAILDR